MRIVHCIYSFNTGGAETMLIDIVNEQVKTEEVILMIVNDSFDDSLIKRVDGRVHVILMKRRPNSRSLWPIIRLNLLLLKLHPEIIHIHNSTLAAIIFPFPWSKMFMTVHDLHIPLKHYLKKVKCLFAISEAVKDDILKQGIGKVVTIPNGIVIDEIEKRDVHLWNASFRIVQVARLEALKKGQDILIKAIAVLRKRGINNIHVDFIGSGTSEIALKELSEKLGVMDQISFCGLRDRRYIYAHLKDYDLMCHPARYEGFGLTVAEAMAAKLPVLVSNEGGPYEIIEKGKYGYAFKMEDVDDCAEQIEYIYKYYTSALQKTEAAYQHVVENYSVEKMVQCYVAQYKKYVSR